MFRIAALMTLVLLAGCSSREPASVTFPAPQVEAQIELQKEWQSRIGSGVGDAYLRLTPALLEDGLFVVSAEGILAKLEPESGRKIWRKKLKRDIIGGLGTGFGQLALGSANGELLLVDGDSGDIVWQRELSAQITTVPIVAAGEVIAQTVDGRLHCLNRETGDIRWQFDTEIPSLTLRGESNPQLVGQILLAGFANGKLMALDADNGALGWEQAVSVPKGRSELERLSDVDGDFVISGKTVFVAGFQGNLVAIDIPSGRVLWQRKFSTYLGIASALGQLILIDDESVIHALDARTGASLWQQENLKGRRLSSPAMYDRYIVVADQEGYLYWLDYADGEFLVRVKVGNKTYELALDKAKSLRTVTEPTDGIRVKPLIQGSVVYVQANSGELVAYRVVDSE